MKNRKVQRQHRKAQRNDRCERSERTHLWGFEELGWSLDESLGRMESRGQEEPLRSAE